MPLKDPEKYAEYQREYYLRPDNRRKAIAKSSTWARENPVKTTHNKRTAYMRKKYKLDMAEYEAMSAEQDHRCAICNTEDWAVLRGWLCVDHDHLTGKVRGLLCHHCNAAIGNLQDRVELLEKAIAYLKGHAG